MRKNTFKIKGMFCTGCENRIQNRLKTIDGIKTVKADWNKNSKS